MAGQPVRSAGTMAPVAGKFKKFNFSPNFSVILKLILIYECDKIYFIKVLLNHFLLLNLNY